MPRISVGSITARPYARLLTTYIIISLIITLLFAESYQRTANSIRQEKLNEMLVSLQRNSKLIDEQMTRVDRLLHNLFLENDMRRIASIQGDLKPSHYQWLLEAQALVNKYELTGGVIAECMIAFNPDSPFMLTTRHVIPNPYVYYSEELFHYDSINYDTFKGMLDTAAKSSLQYGCFLQNRSLSIYGIGNCETITFYKQLRIPGVKNPPVALIMIDTNKMKMQALPSITCDHAWSCITDAKGNILYADNYDGETLPSLSGSAQVFFAGEDSILCVPLEGMNLTFYASIPGEWVDTQMKPFWGAFYLVVVYSLIIGLVISALFAYYNIKPVSQIVKNINRKFTAAGYTKGAYDYIEKSFNSIIASNEEMTNKLEKWTPVIKSGLFERLFKGGIINAHEYEMAPEIKHTASGGFYVIVVGWQAYPGKSMGYTVQHIVSSISEQVAECYGKYIIHPIDGDKAAILFQYSEKEDAVPVSDRLAEIAVKLSESLNMLFAVGIGGKYEDLSLVSVSCFEARRALAKIKDWHDCRVMWYESFTHRTSRYEFPFEYMDRLYNYILAGDEKLLKILVEQIYNRNFQGKVQNDNDVQQFYNDLMRILDRISTEMPVDDVVESIPRLSFFKDASEVMDCFLPAFQSAAAVSKKQKNIASGKLLDSILEYVEKNYHKPDISLQSLAMQFDMSDKYMSLFFKEKTGNHFSKSVENKRLTEAVRLMMETNKSISEIRELVGYTSTNTFYKAFCRKYGMSPTLWYDEQRKRNTQNKAHTE